VFHRDRLALLSSELNAQIEHQTARDSTVGADKPLGERGTVMADTVGAKQAKEPAPANGFY
jgi:membrane protein